MSQLRPASHLANGDNFSSAQWFIYQGTILSLMKQILFTPTILDNHYSDNQSLLIQPISIFFNRFLLNTFLSCCNHFFLSTLSIFLHLQYSILITPFSPTNYFCHNLAIVNPRVNVSNEKVCTFLHVNAIEKCLPNATDQRNYLFFS